MINLFFLFFFLIEKPVVIEGGEIILDKEDYYLVKAKGIEEIKFYPRKPEGIYQIPLSQIIPQPKRVRFDYAHFDTLIQQMVNKVSSDTILSFVSRLQNFRTRYSSTDSAFACANFLKDKFLSYGLDSVYFQSFRPDFAPNVIGIKRGTAPDCEAGTQSSSVYVVICGHFDSYATIEWAPGADDNGSGTACLLEVARILKDYQFQENIRFIAFSGEEQGLLGSAYYCSLARYVNRDSIIATVNIDMVAYTVPNRDSCSVIGKPSNPNCAPLVDYFIQCANIYTNLKCQRQVIDRPRSDHASFNRYGYIAIHIRENLNVFNPFYHTTGDTIGGGFNDLNFVTEIAKSSLATIASLAEPIPVGIGEERLITHKPSFSLPNSLYNVFGQRITKKTIPSGIYFYPDEKRKEFRKAVKLR